MTSDADVCVVGSGPAGAILAASLAERNHDVVVLEAGPRFDREDRMERLERRLRPSFDRSQVWDMGGERDAYSTSGEVEYDLNESRVKGVGGTTLHWSGTIHRLHPEDFEMDSRYGIADDWPISYEELEPYYCRAERAMGVSGEPTQFGGFRSEPYPNPPFDRSHIDRTVEDAFEDVGVTLHNSPRAVNSEPYDGRSECVGYGRCSVCPSGAKYSADVHVRKAEEAGARILDRAPVQRLEHDDEGDRITEAVFVRDGETRRLTADQFVIAAGGVESARLLLLSESEQYPDGLANSSGLVGRYFTEHPAISVEGVVDEHVRSHLIGFETSVSEQYYAHDEGPEGTMLVLVTNQPGTAPMSAALEQEVNVGNLLGGNPLETVRGDEWGNELLDRVRSQYGRHVAVGVAVEQLPDRDNRVTLDRSTTDDHGNPVPDLSLSVGERARETLERGRDLLVEILDSLGASEIDTIGSPEEPLFHKHHMGTTRMGTDPESSVVDPDLQTHDLENLYVSSSGAFVTCGAGAPTLTITALTLRLADHLDELLAGEAA